MSNTQDQNTTSPKRGRGRPKKILTPEERQALLSKPKRPRGRPKKILTPEEEMVLLLKKQRGKGRPRKRLTPQEEWILKFSPKKDGKGRPRKDFILFEALPSSLVIDLSSKSQGVHTVQAVPLDTHQAVPRMPDQLAPSNLSNQLERAPEARKPKLSWHEFKEKLQLPDLPENFIFPTGEIWYENGGEQTQEIKPSLSTKPSNGMSQHVLDLRQNNFLLNLAHQAQSGNQSEQKQADNQVDYAWENFRSPTEDDNKTKESFLNFEVPEDIDDGLVEIKFNRPPKQKKKNRAFKVNLISRSCNTPTIAVPATSTKTKPFQTNFLFRFLDSFLINLGKSIYFGWRVLTAPFRWLDFMVDRSLRLVWFLFALVFKFLTKIFQLNLNYLKKGTGFLYNSLLVSKSTASQTTHANKHPTFNFKPALSFVVVSILIVLPIGLWHTWRQVRHAQGNVLGVSSQGVDYLKNASQTLIENDLSGAFKNFSQAQISFKLAQEEINNLGGMNGWLLNLIPQVKQGQSLLRAGELASQIGQDFSRALGIFNSQTPQVKAASKKICNSLPGEGQECVAFNQLNLAYKVSYFKKTLERQRGNIDELTQIIQQIDLNQIPVERRDKLAAVQQNIYTLKKSMANFDKFLDLALEFLGAKQPRRYLVIFQNSNELRASGGFMGSFALVDIRNGNVTSLEIPGGGLYDLKSASQVLVEAPKPLQIFSPTWQIWNANWFPDWPTSAQKIMWFYENLTNSSSIDGVITLTQDVVADLLKYTGPIEMEEYQKTLDADNFSQEVQMAVELEYDKEENQPKQIIADMAPILLERLLHLESKKSLNVLLALDTALKQKKILFYFSDPNTQSIVEEFGWAGKVKTVSPQQDYLMLVHTNISGGKTDGVIKNKVQHQLRVQDDGSLVATIRLIRTHTGSKEKVFENDHNVDYVRFYVPLGSKFISAAGFNFTPNYLFKHATAEEGVQKDKTLLAVEKNITIDETTGTRISAEFGKTVFGNWIQVSPGQEQTAELVYQLPFKLEIKKDNQLDRWLAAVLGREQEFKYSLFIEKQPGMRKVDFTSKITLPNGYKINESITSHNLQKDGSPTSAVFSSDLLEDGYYGVVIKD